MIDTHPRLWYLLIALLVALALACAWFVPWPAHAQSSALRATWARPGVARLVWTQPVDVRETCLYREPAHATGILVQCWNALSAGTTVLHLGAVGPLDAAYRPAAGDVLVLIQDGEVSRAALRGVVYLGVVTR